MQNLNEVADKGVSMSSEKFVHEVEIRLGLCISRWLSWTFGTGGVGHRINGAKEYTLRERIVGRTNGMWLGAAFITAINYDIMFKERKRYYNQHSKTLSELCIQQRGRKTT